MLDLYPVYNRYGKVIKVSIPVDERPEPVKLCLICGKPSHDRVEAR